MKLEIVKCSRYYLDKAALENNSRVLEQAGIINHFAPQEKRVSNITSLMTANK